MGTLSPTLSKRTIAPQDPLKVYVHVENKEFSPQKWNYEHISAGRSPFEIGIIPPKKRA